MATLARQAWDLLGQVKYYLSELRKKYIHAIVTSQDMIWKMRELYYKPQLTLSMEITFL